MTTMYHIKRGHDPEALDVRTGEAALTWVAEKFEYTGYGDLFDRLGYVERAPVNYGDLNIYVGELSGFGPDRPDVNPFAIGLWAMSGSIGAATAGMRDFVDPGPYLLYGPCIVTGSDTADGEGFNSLPDWVPAALEGICNE